MCYYKGNSGIPWEDSPSTGGNPTVTDAVVLSYVSNNQFTANTVSYYNNYDSTHNKRCVSRGGCPPIGNQNIGINVGVIHIYHLIFQYLCMNMDGHLVVQVQVLL